MKINLPPLKCPGGQRMTNRDIRTIHKVPSNGYLKKYDLRFLTNLKLSHMMMRHLSVPRRDDRLFVEFGPGPGALTRSLLTLPSSGVFGIEVDGRYNAHLDAIKEDTKGRFQWCNANVLTIDECELLQKHYGADKLPRVLEPIPYDSQSTISQLRMLQRQNQHAWKTNGNPQIEVVANLPFVVALQLGHRLATDCSRQCGLYSFGRVAVHMFYQKELAEKLSAMPGSKMFGRMSVLHQNYFRVNVRATFRETTYFPVTEVGGALVTLEPRTEPLVDIDGVVLENFLNIIFREKENRQSSIMETLRAAVPEEVARYILAEIGVDPQMKSIYLSVTELAKMALVWQRFLEATNQPPSHERRYDHIHTLLHKEQATENHNFDRATYEASRKDFDPNRVYQEHEPETWHRQNPGSASTPADEDHLYGKGLEQEYEDLFSWTQGQAPDSVNIPEQGATGGNEASSKKQPREEERLAPRAPSW